MIKAIAVLMLAGATLGAQAGLDTSRMRNDLFAGFTGNQEAVSRALDESERLLAEFPDHPQALVWHGAATLARSQRVLQDNREAGIATFQKGIAEMDRAVELAPR